MTAEWSAEVVVVGAGPAGLAAAATAAEAGARVVVVDANRQPGGQYWRHGEESVYGVDLGRDHHDRRTYRRLRTRFDAARDRGRLRHLPGTQVWFVESASTGFVLRLTGVVDDPAVERPTLVRAEKLILCPGGYDRQLPVPGWDLPGVMAAGGVQALLKGHGTVPGARAVVAGTGPFLLPVAVGLAAAGVDVVGICEAGAVTSWLSELPGAVQTPAKGIDAVGYAARLARHRIPYWTRSAVTRIRGTDRVDRVSVARLDRAGRSRPGTERELEVDLVALGWGFTPSLELVAAVGADTRVDVDGSLVVRVDADQRTSVDGVYAAGEVTGVGGAMLAVLEGELAGWAAVGDHRSADPRRVRRRQRAIGRGRAFAAAMHRAHPVPAGWPGWLDDSTVVCRCEEVTYAEIRYARDELGADDARTMKLLSRPGMGWCQGRVCGFATARLAAPAEAPSAAALRSTVKRPLVAPVTLAELAACAPPPRSPERLDPP